MSDLITRNLRDQVGNFGQETVVGNVNGLRQFIDPQTGDIISRKIQPDAFDLNNSPLDNSFQLDPQVYNISRNLFQAPGVPDKLSDTFGAIAAVTSKSQTSSPQQLFQNGLMSRSLVENVNFFRTAHSQIGINDGSSNPPWTRNLLLGTKILNQTG